eukprot:TRINITY_DN1854_c1_g2_i1.p1 TRINITY_DN1854_c1_g2~~TRINITY_DN1854_c1_g2_i1.p1  ORF type:complete len:383 (+),score=87.61 TRINITY_DN1854_c1_g2_i1:85-1149(+)
MYALNFGLGASSPPTLPPPPPSFSDCIITQVELTKCRIARDVKGRSQNRCDSVTISFRRDRGRQPVSKVSFIAWRQGFCVQQNSHAAWVTPTGIDTSNRGVEIRGRGTPIYTEWAVRSLRAQRRRRAQELDVSRPPVAGAAAAAPHGPCWHDLPDELLNKVLEWAEIPFTVAFSTIPCELPLNAMVGVPLGVPLRVESSPQAACIPESVSVELGLGVVNCRCGERGAPLTVVAELLTPALHRSASEHMPRLLQRFVGDAVCLDELHVKSRTPCASFTNTNTFLDEVHEARPHMGIVVPAPPNGRLGTGFVLRHGGWCEIGAKVLARHLQRGCGEDDDADRRLRSRFCCPPRHSR